MILFCYGTRPEYIKIKKIIDLSKNIPHKILYVSQHEDIVYGNYDYRLNIIDNGNRLDSIVSSILNKNINEILNDVDYVMVQGDTASAFAIALSAFHRKIKIIHLEAGLRTYNNQNPYPEESYRQFISRISDIHLCPTETNKQNLINEKINGKIYVVGNTVLDNLTKDNLEYQNKILITLHRRENHEKIEEWFKQIEILASENTDLKFILPIHPNPNVIKHKNIFKHVSVIDPLGHDEFINLLKKCKLIISDSGGIQEESSFLNKKVIVCRKVTERIESLNKNSFLCENPEYLKNIFYNLLENYEINIESPYGDGKSSEKIIEILKKL